MCGFAYREERGFAPSGFPPGMPWSDVPDDWKCPMCGSPKNIFRLYSDERFERSRNIVSAGILTPIIQQWTASNTA
ncbi:MAG: rubredoxin [Candidatus Methanomethylophilus sp.]|nr:rubredoxin [Methanomethylophilus sp.]MCI2093446.1 rubredoxin [Methanomethylophilus sp.]WII10054.1 rubredoxin [Methanomassiliicoccales archaeon LGM-DZ1]